MALATQLENERIEELELLFKTILKAGGFEFKKEKKVNNDPKHLPPANLVLQNLMGKGGVVVE